MSTQLSGAGPGSGAGAGSGSGCLLYMACGRQLYREEKREAPILMGSLPSLYDVYIEAV